MNDDDKKAPPSTENTSDGPWGMDVNTFCMLMHLSQFAGFVVPGAGLVLPIIMWATNKDQYSEVNLHGLIILNWMISFIIYATISVVLFFIFIGVPMLMILCLLALIFTIIGAIKANDRVYWPYPMSIDFFGVKAKLADQ